MQHTGQKNLNKNQQKAHCMNQKNPSSSFLPPIDSLLLDNLRHAPVADVIAAFGGLRPMASQLGVAASTVQGWKDRNKIPENRLNAIAQKMQELHINLDGETFDQSPIKADSSDSSIQLDSGDKQEIESPQKNTQNPTHKGSPPVSSFAKFRLWAVIMGTSIILGGGIWVGLPHLQTGIFASQSNSKSNFPTNRSVEVTEDNNKPSTEKTLNPPQEVTKTPSNSELVNSETDIILRSYGQDISTLMVQNQSLKTQIEILQDRVATLLAKPTVDSTTVADLKNQLAQSKQQESFLRQDLETLQNQIKTFENRILKNSTQQNQQTKTYIDQQVKKLTEQYQNTLKKQSPSAEILRLNQMILTVATVASMAQTERPFVPQAQQLTSLFVGVPPVQTALNHIQQVADRGVLTPSTLHEKVSALLPALQRTHMRPDQVNTWTDFAISAAAQVFTVRRTHADTPDASPVSHIETALAKNDFATIVNVIQNDKSLAANFQSLVSLLESRVLFDTAMATLNDYLQNRTMDSYVQWQIPPQPQQSSMNSTAYKQQLGG